MKKVQGQFLTTNYSILGQRKSGNEMIRHF